MNNNTNWFGVVFWLIPAIISPLAFLAMIVGVIGAAVKYMKYSRIQGKKEKLNIGIWIKMAFGGFFLLVALPLIVSMLAQLFRSGGWIS